MENKKILNATPIDYQGIKFRSTIEKTIYRALIQQGINPKYEGFTFVLSESFRPKEVPYYTRRKLRGESKTEFRLDMSPVDSITYTPDFTFTLNDIFVIVEVKGFVNDTYPIKRNLFRKYLESFKRPVMYFEVRSKKELLIALNIVQMETPQIAKFRKLIAGLPDKEIPVCYKYLDKRDFVGLQQVVDSVIRKIERSIEKKDSKYANIDLNSLYILQAELTSITIHEESI